MRTSDAGFNLIAEFEGFSPIPYNDPVGHCTIGIGHLLHGGNCTSSDMRRSGTLTYEGAVLLLQEDVRRYEEAVNRFITVQLNQNQFDALVSFTFNLGIRALERSTLRTVLNWGRYDEVPEQLARWNKAGNPPVVLAGLTRRRAAEAALWRTPWVPVERRHDLLSSEYDELKREIRIERDRIDFLARIANSLKGAIDFAFVIIKELVKRTGGPGVQ